MKTLYLVRHAKSSWDDPFQDDFDRPLNDRGRRDAPRMAKRLKEREIYPDLLISSPAQRALSTCMLMAETAGYPATNIQTDRRLYHASDEQILKIVHEIHNNNDSVVLFSHNPGLTEFANRLVAEPITDNIPTCGVVCVELPVASWKDITWGQGALCFFDYPKKSP